MNEFSKRLLYGAIYVILLIGCIVAHPFLYTALILVFFLLCIHEFLKLIHLKSIFLYGLGLLVLVYISYWTPPKLVIHTTLLLTIITLVLLLHDLIFIRIIPMFEKKKYFVSVFYILTGFLFMSLVPYGFNNSFTIEFILSMFILIWVNDSFAYLIGKKFGKHKLYSRISPKKTIEGFAGGFVFSIIATLIVATQSSILNWYQWIGFAAIVSVFGTIGDLIQSKFKRQAGVKDSGNIIPGHGGIFDRLDSAIYASPFVFLYLQILSYVS